MRVAVIPLTELSGSGQQRWCKIQTANPKLMGPCFRPELFAAVGQSYRDVQVAVVSDNEQPQAFLPFLKDRRFKIAEPVPLCDYQAVISAPSNGWDIREILRKAGLIAWDLHHLANPENIRLTEIQGSPIQFDVSRRINLSSGIENYLSELKQRNTRFRHLTDRRREIERDVGPVRFVPYCDDPTALQRILDWRSQRFSSGGSFPNQVRDVLDRLVGRLDGSFSGIVSGLYAGDVLAAAHFGLRCQGILYYWFPAFNPAFSKYSPGSHLLYELISNLAALDCHILDMGPGGESYKKNFSNDTVPYAYGSIELPSLVASARAFRRRLRTTLHSNKRLYNGLHPLVRMAKKLGGFRRS